MSRVTTSKDHGNQDAIRNLYGRLSIVPLI